MRRKLFFLALVFITALTSQAQITVTGTVFDADEGEPLEYAVTAIMRDTAIVGRANTDEKGVFTIPVKEPGMYKLRISYIGYSTFSATFNVEENKEVVNLDTVLLGSKNSTGNRAIVTATVAKVQQVEDTTVYNASAYRVPEGSTLEALIKQLPGVQVSDEGTITWNGKTVSEFLINGKNFFKGNTDVAMKNLPTDLVSKIKAYDRKSDYTQQTGIDDGEEVTVMDISTKRELNQSWITNITGGYGTEHRYSAQLFISRFTDKSHISLMAAANNVSDRGFGGPRGFGGSNGLTASKSINFSAEWDNGKKRFAPGRFEIEGDIRFNHRSTDVYSRTASESFLSTGSTSSVQSFGVSQSQTFGSNTNLNANLELDWSPDSMTAISFEPTMSYSNSRSNGTSLSATFNDDPFTLENIVSTGDVLDSIFATNVMPALRAMTVNRNTNYSKSKSHSFSTNARLNMTRRIGKNGRNFNISLNGGFGNSKSRSFSISNIDYFQQDRTTFQNIYSYNPSKNWNYNVRLGYVEPLGKKWFAEARYQYSHRFTDGERQRYALHEMDDTTYRYNSFDWALENFGSAPTDAEILSAIRDERNSQYAKYHYSNHNITLGIRYNGEKIRTNIGVSLNPQHTKMDYNRPALLDTVVTRDVFNVSPEFNFRYSFSRTNNLEFRFRGQASQPSMTNLLDVWDDSNPLSISGGNPNLKPSWANSFNANYRGYNTDRQQGINARLSFNQTLNSISSRTVYDEATGVRYTRPDNINGNWNINGNFMFNTPIDAQKLFNVTTYTDFGFQRQVGYMSTYRSGNNTPMLYDAVYTPRLMDAETTNYQEIFDRATSTSTKGNTRTFTLNEALTLTYKHTYFDIGANGNIRYQNVRSTLTSNNKLDTWQFSYGLNGNLHTNIGISFSTDIRMSSRRGYSSKEMNTNELLWNAQLSYSFLSNKAATVRLQWNDILQQQSNISRTISATSRTDRETNAINSYFMVSFTYKLNIFGGTSRDKQLQQRNGPSGRRPGDGPPPGGRGGGRPGGGGGFGGGRPGGF